jgi:FkbM family methyltransferase
VTFISYAQNLEDVLLNRVFAEVDSGFYVDVGAYDPVKGSVTKAFYDRGWSGINLEPGAVFEALAAARPCDVNLQVAVLDYTGNVKFLETDADPGMSHVLDGRAASEETQGGTVCSVICDTLANVIAKHSDRRPIDFLKIDAEGTELAIIRSTDWRAIRPTVLVIEATLPWSNRLCNDEWEPILLAQGYVRAYFDGINCFYVPEERSDLFHHFELPVNVLDGFVQYTPELAECRDQLVALQQRPQQVETPLEPLSAENARYQEQHATDQALLRAQAASAEALTAALSELRRLHDERVSALQEQCDALTERMQTERNELLERMDAERNAFARQIDQAAAVKSQREALLTDQAARLHRLARELQWPDGPRALRMVLPLARIARRLKRTPVPAMLSEEEALAGISVSDLTDRDALTLRSPVPHRPVSKRLALLLYAPFRPIVRPMAWRARAFLTAEIHNELALLDERLQSIGAHQDVAGMPPGVSVSDLMALHAELRQFGKMLETTLLTLALERDGE